MTNQTKFPDYSLEDVQVLTTLDQVRALSHPLRHQILGFLGQQAATTKQLAAALELPKGTVAHHLKVLETAGLITVVRTRQVRAITEKFFGRVARRTRIVLNDQLPGDLLAQMNQEAATAILQQAISEIAPTSDPDDPSTFMIVRARIPASEARRFAQQVERLTQQFGQYMVPGEPVYGFVAGVYLTNWPDLPHDERDDVSAIVPPEESHEP
jgi:DNA-binding transcriptional ArsR family regulator